MRFLTKWWIGVRIEITTVLLLGLLACSQSNQTIHPQQITPFHPDQSIPDETGSNRSFQCSEAPENIILISIDTLRFDPLGCYGNPDAITPVIDRLSSRGVVFENSMVQLPGTLPSHMTMMTSLYPRQHQVYPPDSVLNPSIKTAAEYFKAHGYACAGFTEGGYVHGKYGFSRGFDIYDDTNRAMKDVISKGAAFIDKQLKETPFFLFLHTYQVHDPYYPEEPYKSMYCDPGYTTYFDPTGPNLLSVNMGNIHLSKSDISYLKSLYIAEVRQADALLLPLFDVISRNRLWADTLLILTSDHGEEFNEHGKLVHQQLYEQTIHVPLVMSIPRWKGRRMIPELVETVDLLPSMFAFLGWKPDPQFQGKDLISLGQRRQPMQETYAYSESFVEKGATLLQKNHDTFKKIIIKNPDVLTKSHVFYPREFQLQVYGDSPTIRAKAYHSTRKMDIYCNDEHLGRFFVFRHFWRDITLKYSGKADRKRSEIQVITDGCDVPAKISDSKDTRCLSVALQPTDSSPLAWIEGYQLEDDPGESINVAGYLKENNWDESRSKLLGFMEYQKMVAQPLKQELSFEQKEQLRKMGYLQ